MISGEPGAVANRTGATGGIEFRLLPIDSLSEVEKVWRELESRGNESFFTSWVWIGSWLTCLPERIRPMLLTARGDGSVIGVAILVSRSGRRLFLETRQLHFNSTGERELDCITIEHNGFLAAPESRGVLWSAFLRWFACQKKFDELVIPGVAQEAIQPSAAKANLLQFETVSPAYACTLPRQGGRDEILMKISSNARQQLRRNVRSLESKGPLLCERATTVETALSWFEALKQFHINSWDTRGQPHAFRWPFFELFHRSLIERGIRSVEMLRVSAGLATIGYLYNFRNSGCSVAYQSGFEEERRKDRPGYVSHLLAMELAARHGAERYDFLAGDNQLKRTFANSTYTMSTWRFARRSLRANFQHMARAVIGKVRVHAKSKSLH